MSTLRIAVAAGLLAAGAAAWAGSETPPAGPPWKRDLVEAQREGLREGRPIFLYLTKTH